MKRITCAAALFGSIALYFPAMAQDEIVLKNGDIIQAKVSEVGIDDVKYAKWSNIEGPKYTIGKSGVFMIKYMNGTKDVFGASPAGSPGGPATIYFYRPRKFAGSAPEIIVGTVAPDEVIVKVHNGRWFKADYGNFGELDFVTGVYSINPETFHYLIEPGKTYFIRCTLLSQGFKMMSKLEMVSENTAKSEMSELQEQTRPK